MGCGVAGGVLDWVFGFNTQQVTLPPWYSMFSMTESSQDDPREGSRGGMQEGVVPGIKERCRLFGLSPPKSTSPWSQTTISEEPKIVFWKPCSLIWRHQISLWAESWVWMTQGTIPRPFLGPQRYLEELQVQRKPQNVMENAENSTLGNGDL